MYRMGKEEADAAARVIMSGKLFRINSLYNEIANFEKEFKEKMGANHCLSLTSGTGAIIASLAALGVGPGNEVIIPAYTFIATAVAVLAVGAIPVLADIDETLTLDIEDVKRKLSKHTKAIIPVHIQGIPSNMDAIMDIANKHGVYVVEDVAQADGGSYKGKRLGTYGDCGAFSFNYFKIISAGEGGAILVRDLKVYERAIIYHDCGANFWPYETPITEPFFSGVNMRTSEITGAILREQLKRLDGILSDLRRVKKAIMDATAGFNGLKYNPSNDICGDCGVVLPFLFDDIKTAERFEQLIEGTRPVNTGKHVYSNWPPVMEKRGAFIESMNPYSFEKNKGLNMDFNADSCPQTLDILSRTVYMGVGCEWTDAQVDEKIEFIKSAAKQL